MASFLTDNSHNNNDMVHEKKIAIEIKQIKDLLNVVNIISYRCQFIQRFRGQQLLAQRITMSLCYTVWNITQKGVFILKLAGSEIKMAKVYQNHPP